MSETTTWYRTKFGQIDPVEVSKETFSCVWVNGRRCNKQGGYINFYETWAEARDALAATYSRRVDDATRKALEAQAEYDRLMQLKDPST